MKAGYMGHDSMRERAEQSLRDEIRDVGKPRKMSASAPEKLHDRLYKRGGKAKKCAFGGGMLGSDDVGQRVGQAVRANLPPPPPQPTQEQIKSGISQAFGPRRAFGTQMKKGGPVKHYAHHSHHEHHGHHEYDVHRAHHAHHAKRGRPKKHHEHEMHMGGSLGGDPDFRMAGEHYSSHGHMKRGGRVKKYALGGEGYYRDPTFRLQGAMTSSPGIGGMKKGGKAHKHHAHEGRMVESRAHERREMSKLGKIERMLAHEHHGKKMAMGGVGKIRHKQATASGRQIRSRRHDGY